MGLTPPGWPSPRRLIVSVAPVTREKLGLSTTQGADAVLLCLELGRSRMADVRLATDLVGRERIVGC